MTTHYIVHQRLNKLNEKGYIAKSFMRKYVPALIVRFVKSVLYNCVGSCLTKHFTYNDGS